MPEDTIRTIRGLLSSAEASDLRRGLELARTEIARAGPVAARPLFEMISALFYIDPLDRPDLLPVLDDAVNLVVGLGAWVIPALVEKLDSGDLKAQMAAGHALGRIGADAIDPLLGEYGEREDTDRRCFILYALGKIKSPDVLRALPIAIAAAGSPDLELRDTAVRAIGKFAESIPEGGVDAALSRRLVELL